MRRGATSTQLAKTRANPAALALYNAKEAAEVRADKAMREAVSAAWEGNLTDQQARAAVEAQVAMQKAHNAWYLAIKPEARG